ncbi:TPR end-of-group domain-containing protein [Nonomuraea purpurea]|uniref:TPR end-of-group domain-containing protein n=1 Tax=Nonomuraea purpurea TaxID=1849276 RepID=A0ABV8GEN8_9ACTN
MGEPGLPAPEMLCLNVSVDGRAVELAGVVPDGDKLQDEHGREAFARLVGLLLAGPEMIASGAVGPWLDRVRRETHMYARDADGEWLSLGRGPGRTRTPAEVPAATPLLAALATNPAPVVAGITPSADEARARARTWAEAMGRGGWRNMAGRAKGNELGIEVLAEVAYKHPDGPRQRCAYVLTGDPRVPEALWWRSDQLYDWRKFDFLVDLRGLDDPRLPVDAPSGDASTRAAKAVDILARTAPSAGDRAGAMSVLRALTTVASVHERGWNLPNRVSVFGDFAGRPRPAARDLDEVTAALRDSPEDGELWLETGFAAYGAHLLHVADTAFRRATDLGAGGGTPRLWRAWLSIHHDPHGALREWEVSATEGGVTGAARHMQAYVHDVLLHDPDTALEHYAQATADDSGRAYVWIKRGELLLRESRYDEAVQVFTEALERHADGPLWHWLGYTRLLIGETEAAMDCLEQAVRLRPGMVREIVDDKDLAPLSDHPRFQALPGLAEEYEGPYHRAVRANLRPDGANAAPRLDPVAVERLRDTYCNYEPRPVEPTRLCHSVTDPALRAILTDVGLPGRMGTFMVDHKIAYGDDRAPRRYRADQIRGRGGMPDGWGGLLELGTFYERPYGDNDEVAVDGETGEVFVTQYDRGLRYLAPDVGTFLAALCEDAGERELRIAPGGLGRLDNMSGIQDGRLHLVVEGLDGDDRERLLGFLTRHGTLLRRLVLKRGRLTSTEFDFSDFDFSARCPNLHTLDLTGATVNESVFAHPTLEEFTLREGSYKGVRDIRIGTLADADDQDGALLRRVFFEDCVVEADTLLVGPYARLEAFTNVIDEDYGGVFPEHLEFADCEDLGEIYINADAACWELTLRGHLPKLYEIKQDATPYGRFTSTVADASAKDEARYRRLIKRGKDFTKRW